MIYFKHHEQVQELLSFTSSLQPNVVMTTLRKPDKSECLMSNSKRKQLRAKRKKKK